MKTPGTSYLKLRHTLAPAALMVSFAAAGQVEAACDPATSAANPLINTTVTCTGTTAGQNGTSGYGVKEDKGNIINVLAGASVNGTIVGININNVSFANPETINNSGDISGATGISGGFGAVNNNAGATISGSGLFGVEILAQGVVTNSGGISGLRSGAILQNGEVTNTASGTITGGINGVEIRDLVKVSNAGTISGGVSGISIGLANGTSKVEIANTGTITGGLNGIESLRTLGLTNSGTITGAGAGGNGIVSTSADVTNNRTGTITGDLNGIQATTTATVNNAGTISAVAADGRAIRAATASVVNTGNITGFVGIQAVSADVNNSGTISSVVGNGILAQTATVTNSGTISTGVGAVALSANTTTLVNSGTIFAGAGSKGINAETAVVENAATGIILGGLNGVAATATATINNAGQISGSTGSAVTTETAVITNGSTGIISGGLDGIQATATANVTNFGAISATGANRTAISSNVAQVDNAGIIAATGFGGTGIFAVGTADVINRATGIISGRGFGVLAGSVNVTNAGIITADQNAIQGANVAVANAGSIAGGTNGAGIATDGIAAVTNESTGTISGGAFGIGAGVANVVNAGTITGTVGIQATDATRGSTITTSGTIAGTGGTAIAFNAGAGNTLTLAPGFVINGNVINAAADITNTLQFGGSGNAIFDVSAIGPAAQYRNFGSLNKVDISVFTLTGTSTFAGPVNVNGGILAVNGNTASFGSLSVNAGATLGGNGTVGNTTINGGILAPGNSIGLLTVQGNLVFTAASSYLVEVSAAAADRTNVTGVATLGGATVTAVFAPGGDVFKQYTIVNAAGGVSGIFNPVVGSNNANVQSTLSYDANDAFLNVQLVFAAPNGLNTNQQNVANALSGFFNSTGSIPAVFAALGPGGLTLASGEAATGTQQTTFNAMNQFMGLLTDPFIAGRGDGASSPSGAPQFATANDRASAYTAGGNAHPNSELDAYAAIHRKAPIAETFAQRWSVWAAGYGGSQTTEGNAALGSNSATSRLYGTAVGADYRFSPFTLAGFAFAGGGTSFSIANGLGSGRSDLFQAGAFIRHAAGPAYVSAALAYGWQDITTDRTVTIAGFDQLRARFNANTWSGRVDGGYRFVTQGVGLTPYSAGQFTTFELPSYAETALVGTNIFALGYSARNVTATRSEVGLRLDKSFAVKDAILTLRGRAAWAHDFNPDRHIAATFQALPGASFVVNGAAQSPDAALATASAEMKWLNGFSLATTLEGEFSNVTTSYAGKVVARYAW